MQELLVSGSRGHEQPHTCLHRDRYGRFCRGNTLTIQSHQFGFGPVEHSTLVLRRQTITAVEELRQPEETLIDCFTCHQFWDLPLRRPLFADEAAKQKLVELHDPTTLVT